MAPPHVRRPAARQRGEPYEDEQAGKPEDSVPLRAWLNCAGFEAKA
jgi:hypothetical protein